jgi:hypothetical protein
MNLTEINKAMRSVLLLALLFLIAYIISSTKSVIETTS